MKSSMLLLAWSGKMMFVHLVVAQQAQIAPTINIIGPNSLSAQNQAFQTQFHRPWCMVLKSSLHSTHIDSHGPDP